jgi:short-subunit dehydrogenase
MESKLKTGEKMTENSKKYALITGASTGIGYELSKLFAQNGFNLALIARDQPKLSKMAGEFHNTYGASVKVIAKDLSTSSAADEVFAELKSTPIDVLVNNAGSTVYGLFSETNLAKELQIIQLNLVSLTALTKLFLAGMLERGSGRILNIGSTGSFVPGPLNAVYCATKAYVLSFSDALTEELRGTGITVTTLCPGSTLTEFHKRGKLENTRVFNTAPMSPKPVAEAGYRALMAGKRLVVPGFQNQLITMLPKVLPRPMVTRMVKYFMSEI